MYRMNYNHCSSPRDRLDESLLTRIAAEDSSCNICNQNRKRQGCGCNQSIMPRNDGNDCGCENNDNELYDNGDFNFALAMAYSPYQEWQNLFCEEEGFVVGTIFKELDKPFYGQKCHGGACNE